VLRVLVDADNVAPRRLQPVLTLLGTVTDGLRLTASGRRQALGAVSWPQGSVLLTRAGWQRADLALAAAYTPDDEALVLVTGDGDFALLAERHPGSVLVISGAASGRLRDTATVVDPATEGVEPIRLWLTANRVALSDGATAGSGGRAPPADVVLEQQAADSEQNAQHPDEREPDLE